MNTVQEIKQALGGLTRMEREVISMWIRKLEASRVGEPPAPAYGLVRQQKTSVEEYLELEEASEESHEYIDGVMYAMSAGSVAHGLITADIYSALRSDLRGTPCTPYIANVKVRLEIDSQDIFYIPDVMVVCTKAGAEKQYLRFPKVVIEVLSPSTERTDRREKLKSYAQIESVEEYVLVAQDFREVTVHRRHEGWKPAVVTDADAIVELKSLGLSLSLADVYERIPFAS